MKEMIYPDFSDRSASALAAAIRREVERNRAEVDSLRSITSDQATFANTVLPLEASGKGLDLASAIFFNLLHCDADDEMMAVSDDLTALLTDLSNEIGMCPILATNVKAVYEREYERLEGIDRRLLQRTYEGYRDGGAFLEKESRERLKQLRKELSSATLKFSQNLLVEQNRYTLPVYDAEAIKRLPASALEAARNKAQEEGVAEGWLFDLSYPSYIALMKYCDDPALRQRIAIDRATLCNDPKSETSNRDLVHSIVKIRREIALLQGYESYSYYALRNRMARSPQRVLQMLDDLYDAYMPLAQKEVAEVQAYAQKARIHPTDQPLMPWDWSYYAEQYKQDTLDYDEEETRPFFALDSVMKAMLGLASDLYDISFVRNDSYSRYHPQVITYDVCGVDQQPIGVLMTDFHPRKGKQSGAWMTSFVDAYDDVRPVVSIVMNFSLPTADAPALLTFDEATTLFHEFGHALHGLLTKVPYASLSGTSVVRDFVELPSQIMENWMRSRDFVKSFARHYKTGEEISDALLDAIEKNTLFLEGYACIRQLSFGYLDMAWHAYGAGAELPAIEELEAQATAKTRLLPHIEGTAISTSFSHIFSGGYAVGYYGYKWAEILDADAFEEFVRHGLRDKATAQRFRTHILEQGDADDADELYRRFKGRDASVDALKHRSGLQ